MFGRRRQRIIDSKAPVQNQQVKGPILTNGALEFIYQKPYAYPLITLLGGGVATFGQMNVYQNHQLQADLALTVAPVVGAGYPAQSLESQDLISASDEGDY